MPEMSRTQVGHGNDGLGLLKQTFSGNRSGGGLSNIIGNLYNVNQAKEMQGAQHQHEVGMQVRQHGHESNLALIHGATDIEKTKISTRGQVHIARAQGASQVDMAKIQAEAGLKEQAAGHRHEIRLGQEQHQQGLEKTAQEHHLATGLVGSLMRKAEPGTGLGFTTAGGTQATFTTRNKTAKPTAPAASKPQGPQPVGMPINIATAGKPAAPAAAQPKPPVLMANHPVTGSLVRRDSLSAKELAAADAKRAAKSNTKKATVKKAATKKKK